MKKVFFVLFLFVWAFSVQAQHDKPSALTLTVSTDTVGMNEYLTVTYELKNADKVHTEPPVFEGFKVVSGPNISTSMNVVNGDYSYSNSYVYTLQPIQTGTFEIPAAVIVTKTGTLTSPTAQVTVVSKRNVQRRRQPTEQHLYEDPFTQMDQMMKQQMQDMNRLFNTDPFFQFNQPLIPQPFYQQPPLWNQAPPKKDKRKTYSL